MASNVVKQIRKATRRRFSAEEKIRIVGRPAGRNPDHRTVPPRRDPALDLLQVVESLSGRRQERVDPGHPAQRHGKTIGPVPTPDEGTPRGEWVNQLVAWHQEARKWGWYDKGGEELWEERAADLKADPSEQLIRGLLARAEEDHKDGRLLEETYALWHYNLEFLLKMPR